MAAEAEAEAHLHLQVEVEVMERMVLVMAQVEVEAEQQLVPEMVETAETVPPALWLSQLIFNQKFHK
jgi:hypothetical protein